MLERNCCTLRCASNYDQGKNRNRCFLFVYCRLASKFYSAFFWC